MIASFFKVILADNLAQKIIWLIQYSCIVHVHVVHYVQYIYDHQIRKYKLIYHVEKKRR